MPEQEKWPAKERCDNIFEMIKKKQEKDEQNNYKGVANFLVPARKKRVRRWQ